jgi:hypothetical protein
MVVVSGKSKTLLVDVFLRGTGGLPAEPVNIVGVFKSTALEQLAAFSEFNGTEYGKVRFRIFPD